MNNRLSQNISQLYNSDKLPWIIIGVGIILRLVRYLYNPSLWFDESDIAIDIIRTPWSELIYPSLDYSKSYPFLFLMSIKLATQVLGNSEYALRLFPFLSGVISLFLFYRVAKHYIEPQAVLVALGLFAVLDSLVFQSSNLKPYSSDVLFTLLIFSLAGYVQSRKFNVPCIILFGISGAFAVWFSNPSVFVLAGVGTCLGAFSLINKDWKAIGKLSISYSLWILSFIANYFYYIRPLQASFTVELDEMLSVMENAYMPIPPKSIADIKWFLELFFDVFNNPVAMTLTGISALAFLIGCIYLYTQNRRRFFLLLSPVFFALFAAALHEYPFKGRFIFFLLPIILIIIAEGAEYTRVRTFQNAKIIGITFILLLFLHPLSTAAYRVKKPFYWEDLRPVLNDVKINFQKGDIIYVHYFTQYPFDYYLHYHPEPYRFNEDQYIIGIAPRGWYRHWKKQDVSKYYHPDVPVKQSNTDIFNLYRKDLDKLRKNKRVWILFTESISRGGMNEEQYFVYYLDTIGKQIGSYGKPGISSVYLYDLSVDPLRN